MEWRPPSSFCQGGALVPRVPTPPWAPFPPLHPRRLSPPTPHEGSTSPPSLACPLLLRPCGHGCVWWLGGAAVPGNQARSVWSVCLVGGRTGAPPHCSPLSCHPPQAPLTVRPARPAKPVGSSLETGPCVKPALSLVGGRLEGEKGGRGAKMRDPITYPLVPKDTFQGVFITKLKGRGHESCTGKRKETGTLSRC